MSKPGQGYKLLVGGITLAIVCWFLDSTVHFIFSGETDFGFVPGDLNELWMRGTICALIIAFGFYAQRQLYRLVTLQQGKLDTLRARCARYRTSSATG